MSPLRRALYRTPTNLAALSGALALALGCGGRIPTAAGDDAGTSGCYSPTQNLDIAYQTGSKGCSCSPSTDAGACVQGVALVCEGSNWQAVEDGPCSPQQHQTYSPSSCTEAGGTPIASPGGALTAENDCPSGVSLGIIDFASSGWDEGGLCCAPSKACGGRSGNTCSSSEYCAYQAGAYCGAADAEAMCKPRPQACTTIYAPVCGCDQKTYPSSCSAAAAGVGVYSSGACT
jgi:hypothetical protein